MMVSVRMRFTGWIVRSVLVLVVRVMNVFVLVVHRLVLVLMFMRLREVEIEANGHQDACYHQAKRRRLVKHEQREHRADERRGREIGT